MGNRTKKQVKIDLKNPTILAASVLGKHSSNQRRKRMGEKKYLAELSRISKIAVIKRLGKK